VQAMVRRGVLVAVVGGLLVGLLAGPSTAYHWARQGWRDHHHKYPIKPSGYAEIVQRFGQPCNADTNHNHVAWRAADDGVFYPVRFHRKLGGKGTEMVSDNGGQSTNLDNDVKGHIRNEHLTEHVLSGIYGYNCRYIAGTTKWSTHAWGIAIDVSSRYEPNGQCHSTHNKHHAQIWKDHRWKWGKSFCDPMHFQYAKDY
jgi:hypothetical protein